MKNILSCRPGSYGRYHDTAYAHLQKIGVKHVEIGAPSSDAIEKTLNELNSFGLTATSLHGSYNVADEHAAKSFKSQVDAAVKLEAKHIFLSVKAGDLDKSIVYGRLREIGDTAAASGVTLILETHPDLITNGDVALQTMRGVNHPNVRVNFDTANIYYYNQGIDGITEMKKVIDYIEGVHLKETNGGYHAWYFPAFSEGIVNFKEVFRLMNAREFYGPFTIEIEGIEGENLTLEQTQERIAKSVEHLRRSGCVE